MYREEQSGVALTRCYEQREQTEPQQSKANLWQKKEKS
jgi:hypothetical protein